MGRDTRQSASELRAVAALIVTGPSPQLVGPCTLVTNGEQTIAFSSSELLRAAGEPLAIALTFDCSRSIPVSAWHMSRTPHVGTIDLGASFPHDDSLDVQPLQMGAVSATVDTRGAPSALVTVTWTGRGFSRRVIPVHVDAIDDGGMADDVIVRLASPDEATDAGAEIEGAALFSWMPADPVLARPPEVLVVALGTTYRAQTFRPREQPALAELYGLDDLARVLPWHGQAGESEELGQVAGEIKDVESGPLAERDLEGD